MSSNGAHEPREASTSLPLSQSQSQSTSTAFSFIDLVAKGVFGFGYSNLNLISIDRPHGCVIAEGSRASTSALLSWPAYQQPMPSSSASLASLLAQVPGGSQFWPAATATDSQV